MKIARTLIDDIPTFIGSEDGNSFYQLSGDVFGEYAIDQTKLVENPQFLSPVAPPQILAIGLNYRLHAEEFNNPIPDYPVVFLKSITSILEPNGKVVIPDEAKATFVDYEVELAIVIGKRAKNVKEENAFDYVLGYTIANDVTSRDWQKGSKGGGQWCRAKSFDTFCPLGPWMVTTDEITDPNNLELKSEINGELRQKSHTSDMIFTIPQLIAFASQNTTLLPGTVILTGTPSGVGAGLNPRIRLKSGDRMVLTIEKIGELANGIA